MGERGGQKRAMLREAWGLISVAARPSGLSGGVCKFISPILLRSVLVEFLHLPATYSSHPLIGLDRAVSMARPGSCLGKSAAPTAGVSTLRPSAATMVCASLCDHSCVVAALACRR